MTGLPSLADFNGRFSEPNQRNGAGEVYFRTMGLTYHLGAARILFDHLVGDGEQARWDDETERVGSPQVDDEFELGHLENRQIGRLFTFEDTACVKTVTLPP